MWIHEIFKAQAAKRGGVVRRKKSDVEKFSSMGELLTEVKRRGFHMIETGDQVVILCNKGALIIHA